MKPNNPFLISGYHSPEYFCDPGTESRKIMGVLKKGRDMTLISGRHMGRKGLIRHIYHLLKEEEPETITIYMNISHTRNLRDFVQIFGKTLLGQLETNPLEALNRVSEIIRSSRPIITFDEVSGKLRATIEVEEGKEEAALREIFEYLQSSGRRVYVTIDEFQQISNYPEENTEEILYSQIKMISNSYFIYAGSEKSVMEKIFLQVNRPFFQSTDMVMIERIEKASYYAFSAGFFEKQGKELSEEVFDYIYDRYEGQISCIQRILNRLYGYYENPDIKLVRYAISEIISERSEIYECILMAYPTGSVELMKAIAKEGRVKEIMKGDFIARYKLKAASSVSSAVKKLTHNGMVEKTRAGYTICDRFMGEWMAKL